MAVMNCRSIIIFLFLLIIDRGAVGQSSDPELMSAQADSLMKTGLNARSSGDYELSQKNYQEAIRIYSELNLNFRSGIAHYNLARTYYSNYQDSLMLITGRRAVELFKSVDSTMQEAAALNQLGNHMSGIGMNRESLDAYNEAVKLGYQIGDSLVVGLYKNNIGLVLKDLGEYQNALSALYESLSLKEDHGASDQTISSSLLNIGLVLDLLNKPDESLLFYARAIEFKTRVGDSLGIARVFSNMAVIHKNLDRYDSAIHFINLSNEILSKVEDNDLLLVNQTNLGNLFKRKGDFSGAKKYLLQALSIAEQEKDKNHIGDAYQNLGALAFEEGDVQSCIDYNLMALELTKETDSYAQMMEIHSNLQEAYASVGQFEEAYRSTLYALQYRDSVYRMEQIRAAEELQTQYETEKKEEQIMFQNAQLEQQESIILRNKIIILTLSVIALLGIFLVWLWKAQQTRKRRLLEKEHEIQLRDAEINAVINSQEKERKRFATDLHDGFGQLISVLKLNLGRLNDNNSRNTELRQEVFDQSENVINDMYAELRNICFDLMPQTLVKRGLPTALREFADRINSTGKKAVEVLVFDIKNRLPELLEVSLYRITQEWVNNILKYSDANIITIQLLGDGNELTLTIEDDGIGFDSTTFFHGVGNGWRNINSRLNLINGDFDLDTKPSSRGSMATINVRLNSEPVIPASTEEQITA